ncbi:anion transporter [Rhizobium phaseoli]|uniref:SLC13 family permease n=1 Tax=Rhizobium phaseoli TaxID=396 RepID=UPI000497EE31|nr:SLC13 family permease [Rhizobium phaseoli]RDJ04706.1 anion transporter [Rhizobium phaseoli]RDJ06959.1 anion transporter [Rhizobium phaseoli]
MTNLVAILFGLTYLGMALGRVPGLRIDRAGIAMIVAVVLVALGAVPVNEISESIHFPTLLLLGGLMILSARVGASGFYDAASVWIAGQAGRPLRLLALTIMVGGILSAFLVNDIVVFAMTPLLCTGLKVRKLDPRPFLLGLAAASNAGSAATLIGNPQNILIGQAGALGFWSYFAQAAVPAIAALVLSFGCIAIIWRSSLAAADDGAPLEPVAFDRLQVGICAVALLALLALFATPLPREISALLVAACLIVSRTLPTRQLFDEIDLPLLILFAALFVVNDAFARTGLPEAAVRMLAAHGLLPDRVSFLVPISLFLSNTIGNVPAVVMILKVWQAIPEGVLVGLAILSTLAGNLFLVGSLANLIVAERASAKGVRLTFRDHAKAGIPITVLSMVFAGLWLWFGGFMPL